MAAQKHSSKMKNIHIYRRKIKRKAIKSKSEYASRASPNGPLNIYGCCAHQRSAVYRRLCHVRRTDQLQLYRVIRSRRHVDRSRSASRVKLYPNWWLWRCHWITWRSGGESFPSIVTVICCCLRMTPTVALMVAMQVRSRDVTAFAN